MRIQHLGSILPVRDVAAGVSAWSAMLGAAPKFVDADRWAQFDVGGFRLALAGADRDSDVAGVMVKVDDLGEARRRVEELGLEVSETRQGPHEERFTAIGPGGWPVLFYVSRA
jgi:hypothetical protein